MARLQLTRIFHCSCGRAGGCLSGTMARLGSRGVRRPVSHRRPARHLGVAEEITVEESPLLIGAEKGEVKAQACYHNFAPFVCQLQAQLEPIFSKFFLNATKHLHEGTLARLALDNRARQSTMCGENLCRDLFRNPVIPDRLGCSRVVSPWHN